MSQEKYGTDISHYGPALLANLYSTRTHFIFELLQNAEDAEATKIGFSLYPDRLEVRHNGKSFSPLDVLSICSIARSSKREDLTQIGKFGIGFKAVYAYTHSPTIHSEGEHFLIKDFVHPWPVAPAASLVGETLFVFPFDHPEVPATLAFKEIEQGLRNFEPNSLLFLRNLEQLETAVLPHYRSVFRREIRRTGDTTPQESLTHVILRISTEQIGVRNQSSQDWLRLEFSGQRESNPFRVSVAFKLIQEEQGIRIARVVTPPVYVYFPTEKYLPTGFLVQGPFRTTPARDNIPGEDEWNLFLIQQIARISRRAFLLFVKNNMLDAKTLECLPIRFGESSLYKPIYQELLAMAKTDAIFPVDGGGYACASQCLVPRGEDLRKLFSRSNLRLLTGRTDVNWAAQGINTDPQLAAYWKENNILQVVEAQDLASYLKASFFDKQTDLWMTQFYLFLTEHRALLRGALKDKPILRTENNEHVRPLNSLGQPAAYLPGEASTNFLTLKKLFASDPQIRLLFSQMGLKEPGLADVLSKYILPQYNENPICVSPSQNLKDLRLIVQAVKADPRILNLVGEHTLLRCDPQGSTVWFSPSKAYLRSPKLQDYFGDYPYCAYVSTDYPAKEAASFEVLGCATNVRVTCRAPGAQNYVKILSCHGLHSRGVDGFDPDFSIEGLHYVLERPNLERALTLWNDVLVTHLNCIEGVIEECAQQNFPTARVKRKHVLSQAGQLLVGKAWLPSRTGGFHRPGDLALEELPEGFVLSEQLAQKLKMHVSGLAELAKQQGVDPAVLDFALKHPEMVLEMQKRMAKDILDASKKTKGPVRYVDKLEESFERPGLSSAEPQEPDPRAGTVRNPALRRERLDEELVTAKNLEPEPLERMSRVVRRVYEGADESLRAELRTWYQGKCQICSDTFLKRDGAPYFEAVHLVGRSQARWLETVGNLLCLCADCSARLRHGCVDCDGLAEQIQIYRTSREGGGPAELQILLCGELKVIGYQEKHLLALQVLVAQDLETENHAH